jgi:nucleoside-diphosphate-sugar epimerase
VVRPARTCARRRIGARGPGEVRLASDGTAWRPLVHIEDISRAILAALEAPRDAVHNRAFDVGRDEDNFRIRDVAEMVGRAVPGTGAAGTSACRRTGARAAPSIARPA